MKMKLSQMFFFIELFILLFYIHKHICSEVFLRLNVRHHVTSQQKPNTAKHTSQQQTIRTQTITQGTPIQWRSQPILLAAAIDLLRTEKPTMKQRLKEERPERSAALATVVIRRTKALNGRAQKATTIKMKTQAQMERLGMANV
jgi:hypothetical protein